MIVGHKMFWKILLTLASDDNVRIVGVKKVKQILIKAKMNTSIQLKTVASSGIDWISIYKENRDS